MSLFLKEINSLTACYKVFGRDDAFVFLTELDVSDISMSDEEVRLFCRLPLLEVLVLESTGIGDEGCVCCLVLKQCCR